MNNHIIVTGGTGYIGSHTVLSLLEKGYQPIVFDNFSNSDPDILPRLESIANRKISLVEGDCLDYESLLEVKRKFHPISGIIHFAAFKAVEESVQNPAKYYQNNLLSLSNVQRLAVEEGIPNLVFSSSAAVYGSHAVSPVTEEDGMGPATSPYALTKQFGEQMLEMAVESGQNLKAIGLRYFNPVGAHPCGLIGEDPAEPPTNLIPVLMDSVVGKRPPLQVFGTDYQTRDGSCIRDYLHVCDLAEAHVRALRKLEFVDEPRYWDVFNVGTGTGTTVLEVIAAFQEVTGQLVPHELSGRRPGDLEAIYADVEKAQGVLGWRTKRSLQQALEDAWKWYSMSLPGTDVRNWAGRTHRDAS